MKEFVPKAVGKWTNVAMPLEVKSFCALTTACSFVSAKLLGISCEEVTVPSKLMVCSRIIS